MGGSLQHNPLIVQTMVVSVGDMAVSSSPGVVLNTYGLGTCIGVVMYDPASQVGGMLHFMLPDSQLSPEKASKRPNMFADTGFANMLTALKELGGNVEDMNVFIAGGGASVTPNNFFNIGDKNVKSIKRLLDLNGVSDYTEDLGGVNNRTLYFKLAAGEVDVKTPVGTKTLSLQ